MTTNSTVKTNWGPTGYLVYKRTYARAIEKENRSEEFPETIERVVTACRTQLKCGFTPEEEEYLRYIMLNMKGLVAGRFLWQLGTTTVNKLGLASLQNCATTVINEPIVPFVWAMDMLMLGSGVGYNIQREYVYEIADLVKKAKITHKNTTDAEHIVSDTRGGWCTLLQKALEAHFVTGKGFSYSTICVRAKGTPIKGFGGTASGPDVLCWGIGQISEVLNKRAGKKMRPIDALDIMNIIGFIVVAGNVRRSAQIAIGDADDLQFLNAKRWDLGNVPNWRSMSNNSVVCNDIKVLPSQFWSSYKGNGEAYGLINLGLSRECGRLGETQYPDPGVVGYNPCAEQSLEAYETCCLAEIVLPNITSSLELFKVASILYRICKHSLNLKCHSEKTQKVVHKNFRMGLGITGDAQATEEQKGWLSKCYEQLRELDKEYSDSHKFPRSIKLTTVKPSGTLSLLAGVTPGVHPGFSRFFIRRIRISKDSTLVPALSRANYPIEPALNFDGSIDPTTLVCSFPCSFPEHTLLAKDVTAIDQLKQVRRLQAEWSDNSVSCTIYYKPEELPAIQNYLKEHYNHSIKSISFLLHNEHGFKQAPYEEITEDTYLDMLKNITPIDSISKIEETEMTATESCDSGACPIK